MYTRGLTGLTRFSLKASAQKEVTHARNQSRFPQLFFWIRIKL
jgi:hypothetical protein